jgi:SAM-dependent methyltransferase
MNVEKYTSDIGEEAQVRFDAIIQRIPSDAQKILNIGVPASMEGREDKGWLHGYLVENLDSDIVGVSLREEEAQKLTELGYDIHHMDGQYIDFDEEFDVIVVGQVFRNFYDFGEFFRRAEKILDEDGKIIYTLGNPHGFVEFRKAWSGDVEHKIRLSPENVSRMLKFSNVGLKLKEFELLPGKSGGASDILWKMGLKRIGSPQYVATIEPSEDRGQRG